MVGTSLKVDLIFNNNWLAEVLMGKENSQTFYLLVFTYFLSVENVLCRGKNGSVAQGYRLVYRK